MADLKGRLLTSLVLVQNERLLGVRKLRGFHHLSLLPAEGAPLSNQEWSSFPASDQLEALDRRMDQLFGHHAALSKWLRSTNACAQHAFDSQLARATRMTSQFMARSARRERWRHPRLKNI